MGAIRIGIVLLGIALPYLSRLPRGASWVAQYLQLSLGAHLFLGALNALAWGIVLVLSFRLRRPQLCLIPLALGFGFLAWAHYSLDLAADAQAGVALVFIPLYALVPIAIGGVVAYLLDRRPPVIWPDGSRGRAQASRSLPRQLVGLAAWMLLCFAAAGIGAIASANAGAFYSQLSRPPWAPPAWLFAPVWTMLYVLMGISAWLVWRRYTLERARVALALFVLQLAVNALWTWIFFQWNLGAAAFVEILILWSLLLATIVSFWRLHALAAALLLPYLAWVTFATALTFSTWQRNPQLL